MLIDCSSESEWLTRRRDYLTASDAANYCNVNPFDPDGRIHLWEEKVAGRRKDLSDKESIRFGKEAEEHIRAIFMLRHPTYSLEYHRFGLYVPYEHPFLAATLDGLLHEEETGTQDILEIKTATVRTKAALEEWRSGELPINYWCQEIHQQICVPEASGTWTAALVMLSWDPGLSYYLETYHTRQEMSEDRPMLLEKAYEMHDLIERKERPATVIRI